MGLDRFISAATYGIFGNGKKPDNTVGQDNLANASATGDTNQTGWTPQQAIQDIISYRNGGWQAPLGSLIGKGVRNMFSQPQQNIQPQMGSQKDTGSVQSSATSEGQELNNDLGKVSKELSGDDEGDNLAYF